MKKLYPIMACFLQVQLNGCMDYVKLENMASISEAINFPPTIDAKHLYPSRLIDVISVGKNCKGQAFKVPPIEDLNKKDRLYYLWFIDNKLAWHQSIIEPEARGSAIPTLYVDEQFLLSHFGKIPKDFFNQVHSIDFYVSDVEYTIPESRYVENAKIKEKEHSDYVYWIVSFSNDPCS